MDVPILRYRKVWRLISKYTRTPYDEWADKRPTLLQEISKHREWAVWATLHLFELNYLRDAVGHADHSDRFLKHLATPIIENVNYSAIMASVARFDVASLIEVYNKSSYDNVKKPVLEWLGLSNTPEAASFLSEVALNSSNFHELREYAVKALAQIGGEQAGHVFARVLGSGEETDFRGEHTHVYTAAVKGLGNLKDPRAIGPLISVISRRGDSGSGDNYIKEIAARQLREHYSYDTRARRALIQYLLGPSRVSTERLDTCINEAFNDHFKVEELLRGVHYAKAFREWAHKLTDKKTEEKIFPTLIRLAKEGDPDAVPVLCEYYGVPERQEAVVRALSGLLDERAIPTLKEATAHPNEVVRSEAESALRAMQIKEKIHESRKGSEESLTTIALAHIKEPKAAGYMPFCTILDSLSPPELQSLLPHLLEILKSREFVSRDANRRDDFRYVKKVVSVLSDFRGEDIKDALYRTLELLHEPEGGAETGCQRELYAEILDLLEKLEPDALRLIRIMEYDSFQGFSDNKVYRTLEAAKLTEELLLPIIRLIPKVTPEIYSPGSYYSPDTQLLPVLKRFDRGQAMRVLYEVIVSNAYINESLLRYLLEISDDHTWTKACDYIRNVASQSNLNITRFSDGTKNPVEVFCVGLLIELGDPDAVRIAADYIMANGAQTVSEAEAKPLERTDELPSTATIVSSLNKTPMERIHCDTLNKIAKFPEGILYGPFHFGSGPEYDFKDLYPLRERAKKEFASRQ